MTNAPTTRETADHAELAARKPEDHRVRAVMLACESRMKGYETPIHAADAKFALDYLLSEIAALRGERDANWQEYLEERAARMACGTREYGLGERLTQAERQRDELRKALSELRGEMVAARNDIGVDDWISFASEALANQGADQ